MLLTVLYILAGVVAAVLCVLGLVIRYSNRIFRVLSYNTFKTSCEIARSYNAEYRPWFMSLDPENADDFMQTFERTKHVTGRDPVPKRCDCTREYCRSLPMRRRRREVPRPEPDGVLEGKTT